MHNLVLKEEKKLLHLSLISIQFPKQMLHTNAGPWAKGSLLFCDVFTIRFLKLFFFLGGGMLSLKGERFHIIYLPFIGECMSDSFVDYTTCCSG